MYIFEKISAIPKKLKFGYTVKSAMAKITMPKEINPPNMNSNQYIFFLLYTNAINIVGMSLHDRNTTFVG